MRYRTDGGHRSPGLAMIRPQHDLPDAEALVEVGRGPVEFPAGEVDAGDEIVIGGDAFGKFPAFDFESAANLPLQHVHGFRRLCHADEQLGQGS